jgi:hypothetical protein
MPLIPRMLVIAALMFTLAGQLGAQESAAAADTAATDTSVSTPAGTEETSETAAPTKAAKPAAADVGAAEVSAGEVREAFGRLLAQHPPLLGRMFTADPSLLSNEPFLAKYPDVAEFLSRHPEIRRNPHYFVGEYDPPVPMRPKSPYEDTVEAMGVLAIFGFIALVLGWAVRTYIEMKRWNRLSARQAEIHNRILERFSTSEELLAYIRTPAGSKFLESAPIPLQTENPAGNSGNRLMWSIHVGIIVAAAALGMLLVSLRLSGEASYGFFALGVIGFCVGAGFIGSAVVSLMLSKRLATWDRSGSETGTAPDEPGVMR